jgi:hypothetical protein
MITDNMDGYIIYFSAGLKIYEDENKNLYHSHQKNSSSLSSESSNENLKHI